MSFLASLFLVVFLIVGPSLSQDSDPIVLLRLTLEAVVQKQDMILQRFDELETKMDSQQTVLQDVTRRLAGVEASLNSTQEELVSQFSREEHYYLTMTAQFNELTNLKRSTNKSLTTDNINTFESLLVKEVNGSNCKELLDKGMIRSGVYTITLEGFPDGVEVYCDQETAGGGWNVILRRQKQSNQVNFKKTFEEYASGFGDPNGELWIGNRALHSMTGEKNFTLRVEAKNLEGESRTGIWHSFSVGSEDTQFTLSVADYSSSSSLGDALWKPQYSDDSANNMKFSTIDRDNDKWWPAYACSTNYGQGGGWWYNKCAGVNPTAPLGDKSDVFVAYWAYWENSSSKEFSAIAISEIQFLIRP